MTFFDDKKKRQGIIVLLFGLWIGWGFGYQTVWQRMSIELDGRIISSIDVPSKTSPRYVTEYLVRNDQGVENKYVAGPTDASLERSLPTGTRLKKIHGDLSYEKNGAQVKFPLTFCMITIGISLISIVSGLTIILRAR